MRQISTGIGCLEQTEWLRRETAMIREAGFDGVDLDLSSREMRELSGKPDAEKRAAEIRKIIEDAGLRIVQGHAPFNPYIHEKPAEGAAIMEDVFRCLPVAAALGIPYLVVHPCRPIRVNDPLFSRKDDLHAMNIDFYTRLRKENKGTGVTLCVENLFSRELNDRPVPGYTSDPADLNRLLDEVPGMGVCLDYGHAMITGYDPAQLVRAFGSRLKITHIHTNNKKDDLHLLPFFKDCGPWQAFCAALAETGYAGTINLELPGFWRVMPDTLRPTGYRLQAEAARLFAGAAE